MPLFFPLFSAALQPPKYTLTILKYWMYNRKYPQLISGLETDLPPVSSPLFDVGQLWLLSIIHPNVHITRSKKMDEKNTGLSARQAGWFGLALALCAVLLFIGGTGTPAQAGTVTPKASAS